MLLYDVKNWSEQNVNMTEFYDVTDSFETSVTLTLIIIVKCLPKTDENFTFLGR